jgi:hypothetical protein
MKMQRRTSQIPAILFALGIVATSISRAQVYDVAADFSTASNPNGPWTYGWSASLGTTLYPYLNHDNFFGLDLWRDQTDPNVSHNGTGFPINPGFAVWPAHHVAFHPGPQGEFSVVRWTASHAAIIAVTSAFTGFDYNGPTTTDVHVLLNGVSVFDGYVEGFGSSTSFATNLHVAAGDTVDVAVGVGRNGHYVNDTTGLSLTIVATAVRGGPELLESLVPCAGPPGGGKWKNHGEYQSTFVQVARQLVAEGLLTKNEMRRSIADAARSDCGKKTANAE